MLSLGGLAATFFGSLPLAELVTGNERGLSSGHIVIGIFLAGLFGWHLLVGRSGRASWLRGAIAGALTAIFAYPATLATTALFNFSPEAGGTIGQATSVTQLSGFGFLTTGFAAMPTMALAGVATALLLRPLYPARPGPDPGRGLLRGLGSALLALASLLVAAFVGLSVLPLDPATLSSPAAPALSREQALAAFAALRTEEDGFPINPACASKLLLQEDPEAPTVIFLHGLTNCPAQADELAPMLFARGYSVFVPRLPGHGELDRKTEALGKVSARDYVAATDKAIEIAHGIGGPVILTGLSAGGVLALSSAQTRGDLDYSLSMAPFLGPNLVPAWANRAAANLLLLLPNVMVDWDSQNPEGTQEMAHAYPRVASRALGQFMLIGEITADLARRQQPLTREIGVLVNEADSEVNARLIDKMVDAWRRNGAEVEVEVIPLAEKLPHDLIDPRQENANTDLAYGLVARLIGERGF